MQANCTRMLHIKLYNLELNIKKFKYCIYKQYNKPISNWFGDFPHTLQLASYHADFTNYIIWLSTLQSFNTVFINNIANLSIKYLDYYCSAIFLLSYLQPVAAKHLSKDDLKSWEITRQIFMIVTDKY